MKNFFKKYYILVLISLALLGLVMIFSKALAVGLILLCFLFALVLFILFKVGIKSRSLYSLLLIVLIIHIGIVLFVYYTNFQPFSGGIGDYRTYHTIAVEISQHLRQGDFYLQGIHYHEPAFYVHHYYPVIIGVIYALTVPEMIVGQLFSVLLVILSVLATYLIVIEINGSKKSAFLAGLIVSFYPSYVFYGSLLLKDTLIVPLSLLGMLFCLKLIKNFLWKNFFIFYLLLGFLIHFRFYIGYALLLAFVFSWFLLSNLALKKRFIYGFVIVVLLGFLPQIFANQGYYGINSFKGYLSPASIGFYQEKAYAPSSAQGSTIEKKSIGFDSSWNRETINLRQNPFQALLSYSKSFTYVALGPFPWQIKFSKQLLILFETIPWYILFFFIIKRIIKSIKTRDKIILPLILFSFIVFVVISIFFNNFGIITRIRIPAFITLLCLLPLEFKKIKFYQKFIDERSYRKDYN